MISNDQHNGTLVLINNQFTFRFIRMRKVAVKMFLEIGFPLAKRSLLECLNNQSLMLTLQKHLFHPRPSKSCWLVFRLSFNTIQLVNEFCRMKNRQAKLFIKPISM